MRTSVAILSVLLGATGFWPSRAASEAPPTAALSRVMTEAERNLRHGELQIAESRYRSALLEGWLLRGTLAIAQGDLQKARSAFERASSSAVETRRANHWRALVHLQLEEASEAIALLTHLISRRPEDLEARRLLAQALIDDAQAAFEAAVKTDPAVRRGYYYLGTVKLLARGRDALDSAIADFEQARRHDPGDPRVHLYLGTALLSVRRFEQAIPILETAASHERTRIDAWRYLGGCYLGLEQVEVAAVVLRRALAAAPEGPATDRQLSAIHYQLGVALRRLGDQEEAAVHVAAAESFSQQQVEGERDSLSRCLNDGLEQEEAPVRLPLDTGGLERLTTDQRIELERVITTNLARAYPPPLRPRFRHQNRHPHHPLARRLDHGKERHPRQPADFDPPKRNGRLENRVAE